MPWTHLNDTQQQWLMRAAEARSMAEQMADAVSRHTMLGIAASYERLAQRAEERMVTQKLAGVVAEGSK